jgi:hypothetical protein
MQEKIVKEKEVEIEVVTNTVEIVREVERVEVVNGKDETLA